MEDFKDILGEFDEVTGDKQKPVVFATFVFDHSGSMMGDEQMCIDNFNEQIQSMKKKTDIDTYVTVIEFDSEILLTGPIPIEHIQPLDSYWTGGTTALNDAIAKGIGINKKMMASKKYDDKSSLIIVVTDGQENASTEFRGPKGTEKLQGMIADLKDTGEWTFTFMAADLKVQDYAVRRLGIDEGNTMFFNKTAQGYATLNANTVSGLDKYYDMRFRGGKSTNEFIGNPVDDCSSAKDLGVDDSFTTSHTLPKELEEKLKNAMRELQLKLSDVDAEEIEMVTKQDGPMIDDPKPNGDPLWSGDSNGDVLKTEGPEGNPLWRKKKKLNEDDADEPERLDEGT